MNEVQQFIQNCGANQDLIKETNEFFSIRFELIASNPEWNLRLIKMLDSSKHSLVLTWLILALLSNRKALTKTADFATINETLNKFLTNFSPTLILPVINKFFNIGSQYADYLLSEQKAIYGIRPLLTAITKIRDNNEQVCGSLHREFAKLCLKAKCYQHALPIIENAVTSFKKNSSPMDVIGYLYYKGLLYTGLKKYQEAIDQFKLAISYPTNCTHKVHTESFKKLILLNLIVNGKLPSLPRHTDQLLKYKLENSFQTYKNLAGAYMQKEDKLFQEVIDGNFEEFERDKNLGLVRKLQKMYQRVRICDLSNTYLTLRFHEMKHLESPDTIEETLFQIITEGQIKAKIDSKEKMISFIDSASMTTKGGDDKEGEYLEIIEELETQNQRIINLMSQIEGVDTGIQQTQSYLKKTLFGKDVGGAKEDSSGDMIMR